MLGIAHSPGQRDQGHFKNAIRPRPCASSKQGTGSVPLRGSTGTIPMRSMMGLDQGGLLQAPGRAGRAWHCPCSHGELSPGSAIAPARGSPEMDTSPSSPHLSAAGDPGDPSERKRNATPTLTPRGAWLESSCQ